MIVVIICAMLINPLYTFAADFSENNSENKGVIEVISKDVLYYALSKDGKKFEALNNNKAVMSPQNCYKLGSPSIFRKQDGTYGLVAAVDNKTDQIIMFDTENLLYFNNQRIMKLNNEGIIVTNPCIEYNTLEDCYDIFWEGGNGKSYLTKSKDLNTFSESVETTYKKAKVNSELPEYAKEDEAAVIALTKEEYDSINKKYGKLHSVSVDVNDIQAKTGEEVSLPDKVDVVYSDGSKTPMNITWETKDLNYKNLPAGEYTVNGKIDTTAEYNSPLALYRADPYTKYDEKNDVYYFTGSNMNEKSASGGGAYNSIVLRKAETINGITDAEEVEVWTDRTLEDGTKVTGWYWAPEIHKIGDKWRIIALASVAESGKESSGKQCIFTCNGDDLMNPENWEYTGYIHNTTDNQSFGSFDTTYFEYNGQSYYVTPKSSQIWITTVDPEDPLHPTGTLVRLSGADRAYETNNGSGKAGYGSINGMPGQAIQEASSVLIHDDKIFVVYAGCTIDMM